MNCVSEGSRSRVYLTDRWMRDEFGAFPAVELNKSWCFTVMDPAISTNLCSRLCFSGGFALQSVSSELQHEHTNLLLSISFLCFCLTSAIIVCLPGSRRLQERYCLGGLPAWFIDPGRAAVTTQPDFISHWNKLKLEVSVISPPPPQSIQSCVLYLGLSHRCALLLSQLSSPHGDVLQAGFTEWHFNKES